MRDFLTWTSEQVVPTLFCRSDKEYSPGSKLDLSISRISISGDDMPSPAISLSEQSSVDMSCAEIETKINLSYPISSTKKKTDSKPRYCSFETPLNRLSVSQIQEKMDTLVLHANAATLSLLKSALMITSEWLMVGGLDGGEIAMHAIKWCKVLELPSEPINIRDVILNAFLRLALQLIKNCVNFSLFKEIVFICNDLETSGEYTNMIQKVVNMTLKLPSSMVELMVETIFDVSKTLNKGTEISLNKNYLLRSLIFNRLGATKLAELLAQRIAKIDPHDASIEKYHFDANCLLVLSSQTASMSYHQEIQRIVQAFCFDHLLGTTLERVLQEVKRAI